MEIDSFFPLSCNFLGKEWPTDFLPTEIIESIFTFLPPRDLFSVALVSKLFQQVSRSAWKILCEQEFNFQAQKGTSIEF